MCLPGCLFVCHLILLLVCFLFNCIFYKILMLLFLCTHEGKGLAVSLQIVLVFTCLTITWVALF